MRKLSKLLALVFFAPLAFAQGPPPNLSKTAGVYVVSPYSQWTAQVSVGNATTGAGSTIVLTSGSVLLPDNRRIVPFSVSVPLSVDIGVNQEIVTPTAVSGCSLSNSGTCTITATFAKLHQGNGNTTVSSGSAGVQDAIYDAQSQASAVVVMDVSSQPDPSTPIPSNISIFDYRIPGAPMYWAGGSSASVAWGGGGIATFAGLTPGTNTATGTFAFGTGAVFSLAGANGFQVPIASSFVSTNVVNYGIDSLLNNVHMWNGAADFLSLGILPGAASNNHVAGLAVASGSVSVQDLGAFAGGGSSFLKCTPNGLSNGNYFGVSGGICAEVAPSMVPVAISASGTTTLLSSYRGEFVKFSATSGGAQTAALPDPTTTGFTGNFYMRLANHSTQGALTVTNNGGSATFNGSASPYSIPEGNSCDITTNTAGTGWSVVCTPGTLTAGSNITLTQTQFGATIAASGTAAAGGSNTQLQFNNSTALGGISDWTTNGTTQIQAAAGAILDLGTNEAQVKNYPVGPQYSASDTLTNSITGSPQFFATVATIPANSLTVNADGSHKALRVTATFDDINGSTTTTWQFKAYLCSVVGCGSGYVGTIYATVATVPSTARTVAASGGLTFLIQATAAAGSSVTLAAAPIVNPGTANTSTPFAGNVTGPTAQTAVPTNGILYLCFSIQYSASTGTQSLTLTQLVTEWIN